MDYNTDITNLINTTLQEVKANSISIEIFNRFYIQKFKKVLSKAVQGYVAANITKDTKDAFLDVLKTKDFLPTYIDNGYEHTAIQQTMDELYFIYTDANNKENIRLSVIS